MNPLHPAQVSVLRIRAALGALVPLGVAAILDSGMHDDFGLPFGIVTGGLALILLIAVLMLPRRRYASWGYAMTGDELQVAHGLWTRIRTIVPFARVQHIDVTQGPVERRFGIGTLVLHTAGTRNSAVTLPGLAFADAERMRDEIRARIRRDPE